MAKREALAEIPKKSVNNSVRSCLLEALPSVHLKDAVPEYCRLPNYPQCHRPYIARRALLQPKTRRQIQFIRAVHAFSIASTPLHLLMVRVVRTDLTALNRRNYANQCRPSWSPRSADDSGNRCSTKRLRWPRSLPPPTSCFRCVSSVCLIAALRNNYSTDSHKIPWNGVPRATE